MRKEITCYRDNIRYAELEKMRGNYEQAKFYIDNAKRSLNELIILDNKRKLQDRILNQITYDRQQRELLHAIEVTS